MTRSDARIGRAFSALSHRMTDLAQPGRASPSAESISSLLAKVDAAKLRYQPGR